MLRCCCRCSCCCCSYCCCGCHCWHVQHKARSGFVLLPASVWFCLSLFLSSPFLSPDLFGPTLGLSDQVFGAGFFSRPFCCSPDSVPSSGAAHDGSVVNPDQPASLPQCHVSVRHLIFVYVLFLFFSSPSRFLRAPVSSWRSPRALYTILTLFLRPSLFLLFSSSCSCRSLFSSSRSFLILFCSSCSSRTPLFVALFPVI